MESLDVASDINGSRNSKGVSLSLSLSLSILNGSPFHLCLAPSTLYLLAAFLCITLILFTTDKLSPNDSEVSCQQSSVKNLSVSSVTQRKSRIPLTLN